MTCYLLLGLGCSEGGVQMYRCLFDVLTSFPLGEYPEINLLDHVLDLFLISGISEDFSYNPKVDLAKL